MKYLKIPMERIGVLIGHNGENKEKIEKISKAKISIDSELGEIFIDDHNLDDPLISIKIENIILAIGRGFSPEKAFLLFSDNFFNLIREFKFSILRILLLDKSNSSKLTIFSNFSIFSILLYDKFRYFSFLKF